MDQTDRVLTHFWSTTFNNDLSDYWWRKQDLSYSLRSVHSWSDATERDSTFILSVEIEANSGRTMEHLIDMLTKMEESPDESSFRHNLSDEIDKCVETLFSRIMRYLKKTKFDKHYPKDITSNLQEAVSRATGELVEIISDLDQEIGALSSHLKRDENQVISRGSLWDDYS